MANKKLNNSDALAGLMKETVGEYEIKGYFKLFQLQKIFDIILSEHRVKIDLSCVTKDNLKEKELKGEMLWQKLKAMN